MRKWEFSSQKFPIWGSFKGFEVPPAPALTFLSVVPGGGFQQLDAGRECHPFGVGIALPPPLSPLSSHLGSLRLLLSLGPFFELLGSALLGVLQPLWGAEPSHCRHLRHQLRVLRHGRGFGQRVEPIPLGMEYGVGSPSTSITPLGKRGRFIPVSQSFAVAAPPVPQTGMGVWESSPTVPIPGVFQPKKIPPQKGGWRGWLSHRGADPVLAAQRGIDALGNAGSEGGEEGGW